MKLNGSGIPDDVRAFIADHVSSVVQLEVLLLMRGKPQQAWSAPCIGEALRISPDWVAGQLIDLCKSGLLSCETESGVLCYRYAPQTVKLDEAVGKLAEAYAHQRVSVISLIFAQPNDRLRTFSDAFRFREDKNHG